jgi:signal transduction histidine kinase
LRPPSEAGLFLRLHDMPTLLYIRLIGFTAGTLLMLFWMVVILGYRRQRNFERVFFFLCLALFLFYGGSLLALNAQIYYLQPPPLLTAFAWTILSAGLCFAPALLIHLHLEYASTRSLTPGTDGSSGRWKRLALTLCYALVVLLAIKAYRGLAFAQGFDFLLPANSFGKLFGVFMVGSLVGSAIWQFQFAAATANRNEKLFHRFVAGGLSLCGLLVLVLHVLQIPLAPRITAAATTSLAFLPIPLFAALIYAVQKYNFLQIGRQTNLMYAVSATFLALLYLSLVRRASGLLEPVLPPEATASILLFVLVIFVEPIQRLLSERIRETAEDRRDDVWRLVREIRGKAREGNLRELLRFVELRIREQFEFEDTRIEILEPAFDEAPVLSNAQRAGSESFSICQPGWLNAVLTVRPHGAMLSGEIQAAMRLLCEQLPAAIDVARLIGEKLRLERELAERERLAALGQMAASISHNLKNPLGSIKTILQVQLENPEMPDSLKSETQMVLAEISRLSNKLGQLLQFSRPAILGETAGVCDLAEVLKEVTEVLRHEAERKGTHLEILSNGNVPVAVGREAVSDITSNLVVNAIEAASPNGNVRVLIAQENGKAYLRVEDNGKGIPADLRDKVMQPFFTTKTQGTGLGLAIVAKRVAEANGTLELESPTTEGRGTRFSVRLPLREEGK